MCKLHMHIIDSDSVYTNNVLAMFASSANIEVTNACNNGPEGLRHVFSQEPDILLMDVQLPGMDGIMLLKETRRMKKPPVVIFSTRFYSEFSMKNALENGASYFLYKPVEYKSLPDIIYNCYKTVHTVKYQQRKKEQQTKAEIDDVLMLRSSLFDLGLSSRLVGWSYIIESVLLIKQNQVLLSNLSKGLYAELALRMNTTPTSVERSLRTTIGIAYERGELSRHFSSKPSNKKFLKFMVENLEAHSNTTTYH